MLKIRHWLAAFALCGAAPWAVSDTLKGPAEARPLTDQVMAIVGRGDVEKGLLLLRPFLHWNFHFYWGPSGWVLNTFKTDDDSCPLFP